VEEEKNAKGVGALLQIIGVRHGLGIKGLRREEWTPS